MTPAELAAVILILGYLAARRRRQSRYARDLLAWHDRLAALRRAKAGPDVLPFPGRVRRDAGTTNHAGPHFPRLG